MRFGILEAGAYGVSQSRKRAFIWAASPEDVLPEWPEPMHVFSSPMLKIKLSENVQYAAARSTASGAPFRAITVRDTIGDLPTVKNGASEINMEVSKTGKMWILCQFTLSEFEFPMTHKSSGFVLHSIKVILSHGTKRRFVGTWLS